MKNKVVEFKEQLSVMAKDQSGRLGGYVLAWWLGVPASLLFLIFLFRGH